MINKLGIKIKLFCIWLKLLWSFVHIGIGIYEAYIVSIYSPYTNFDNILNNNLIYIFAFGLIKCILNIIIGLVNFISNLKNLISEPTNYKLELKLCICIIPNLGVSIWGLIMFFNSSFESIYVYNNILYIEMIFFFIGISIFTILIIILSIIIYCDIFKIKPSNSNNLTNISETI
jgi:hypothetical protein